MKKKKRSDYDYDSPPAAPVAVKRRRYIDLNADDDEEEIGSGDEGVARIRRKLSDDFDRVAGESKIKASKKSIELVLVGKRLKEKKNTQKVEETSSPRTSPRLAKRSSC